MVLLFFFPSKRRHTRFDCDWSSDVCSSDLPSHNPRSLVERVDFVSCPGFLGGGDERERLGLTGGPELVVTNLGVLDFHPESKRMRLRSVHPGVTVADLQEATGFELLLPDGDVPETAAPTAEQVRLLRDVI